MSNKIWTSLGFLGAAAIGVYSYSHFSSSESPTPQTTATAQATSTQGAALSKSTPAVSEPMTGSDSQVTTNTPPQDALDTKINAALQLANQGNPQKAVSRLEELRKEYPNNTQILTELGLIYHLDLLNPGAARPHLESALGINPNNPTALAVLVDIYSDLDDADSGIQFLRTLHDQKPDNSDLNLSLGKLLVKAQKTEEASSYFDSVLSKDPENSDLMIEIGTSLAEAGQPEQASAKYSQAIDALATQIASGTFEQNPQEGEARLARAYLTLADFYNSTGNWPMTQEVIRKMRQTLNSEEKVAEYLEGFQSGKGSF